VTIQPTVLDWLLRADPSIRWQVMRDLLGAPRAAWSAERAKIDHAGWGAQLRARQDPDGQWAGGSFVPKGFSRDDWQRSGQPWTATSFVLSQLREFGLDPTSRFARTTVASIGRTCRWDEGGQPYWLGEVEECINGRTVADGAYFGVDIAPLVDRLVGERLDDGGWNCERSNGSVRSSFHTTINVLEGLLEFEKATTGTNASRQARRSGEQYLLQRHLFRRRSTQEPACEAFLTFHHPNRWQYDMLRALDYFRSSCLFLAAPPDPRLAEAIEHVRRKQRPDGTWSLDWTPRGQVWFDTDAGPGQPSEWLTLRALRVLTWWDGATASHP
jgi:hypothetical protein